MKKIISLFQRNYNGDRLVRDEVTPGAEWVLAGEGWATRKWDGTCCMIRDGVLYKRYDVKKGRTPPPGFEPAQEPDPVTGHWPGWVAIGDGPDDQWHREAFGPGPWPNGTYELCGPKIQGNPEGVPIHILIPHGFAKELVDQRTFEGIKAYLNARDIEGIVWYHPDGRMVKIKAKDFGLERGGSHVPNS